jgi:Transcription factor Tfb2 (p52) C-terminal domain/Transcription factor Tfb2
VCVLQIAILQLFARTDCLLPNMFVGTLTGKSVTEAVQRGITSEMIIRYLEERRHPRTAHRRSAIPEAVRDQLLLWERELQRLHCTKATLYEAFESAAMFESALARARELGGLLWSSKAPRRLVVRHEAHADMRAHMQAFRGDMGA